MPTRNEIYQAIRNADAAGDSESVKKLGAYLKTLPAPKVAQQETYDPTEEMNTTEKVLAGVGKGFHDIGMGVGQLAGFVSQKDVDEAKRLDAPLMGTTAGKVGNVVGNVAATIPTVFIPGAATLPGAAAVGGALGFSQPVASDESRVQNTTLGALSGAGGVVAGRAAKALWKGGKALLEPFSSVGREAIAGRTLNRFGVNAADVAGATNTPTVTGAKPMLAEQITNPTASAGAARLQDSVRTLDPNIAAQMGSREVENNAARVNTLRDLAGQGGAKTAAIDARSDASGKLYKAAFDNNTALTPSQLKAQADLLNSGKVEKLMESPAIQSAKAQAQANAKNAGKPFDAEGSIEGLHDMKLAIDDMIKDPATAAQASKVSALRQAKDRLVSVIETLSPGYKTARITHADMSKPINQMDVAGEVLKRGTSATSDLGGNPRIMSDSLLRTVQDEGKLIKQATGRNLPQKNLADLLEPDQLNKLNAVVSETDKLSAVNRAANGPGAATAQRLASQNVLRQLLGPTGLPESWAESTLLNTAMRPVQFAYNGVAEPKIQAVLSDLIMNPEKARAALAAAQTGTASRLPAEVQAALPYLEHAMRSAAPAITVSGQR